MTGYKEAMRFVLRQADDSAFTWDRGLIVGLHDRVMAGRYPVAGRLRTTKPIFIVARATSEPVFLPAEGSQVEELVDRTCMEMDGRDVHPAVAAAWIHVAVAAVHPFVDGNGRSARILAALAMDRGGFKRPEFTSLEEWWGRHLDDYYALFSCLGDSFNPSTDVTPFIRGHIRAQLHQVRALDLTQKVQRQIWTATEELTDEVSLDRRVGNALWEVFFGRPVTAGYYRSLADVSPATATVDLGATVSAGLLKAEGKRRGRRYVATLELYERIADDLFVDIDDPSTAKDVIISELTRRVSLTGKALGFPAPPFEDP